MKSHPEHRRSEPGDRCLRFRAGLLCCGVVTIFSLYSWRLIHLQYEEHASLKAQQERSHHKTQNLSASRGDIRDTRGQLLACDEPVQQVTFELKILGAGGALANALAGIEGMKAQDLRHAYSLEELQNRYLAHLARIAAPFLKLKEEEMIARIRARLAPEGKGELKGEVKGEVMLTRDLSVSAALELRESLSTAKLGTYRENRSRGTLGGLVFENSYARRYPAAWPLTHIVGFFGETKPPRGAPPQPPRGVAGAERFFDRELTGVPGQRELEEDGWGNEIPAYRGRITPPANGRGIQLSLDLGLQTVVDQALDETGGAEGEVFLDELNAERVIVVLFDPATMGVRAIASRDSKHDPDKPLLINPATEYLYEPGSTIKIMTVAAAISSGKVNGQSRIDLGSGGVWDDEDITAITDEHAASSLTVEEVLVHSSNIGAYKLARMMGTRRFSEVVHEFGFCRLTGFESPMESRGTYADEKSPMTFQTLSRVAFGSAIAVTPAQMCGALGAIINDGMFQPLHLAESWVDEQGQPTAGMDRAAPRRVVSAAAAKSVRKSMLEVVENGTAKPGRSQYFQIAGKTGTAWKAVTTKNAKGHSQTRYGEDRICSFIGFVPADKPRLGGIVIIDTPRSTKHAHFGGKMAAPIFRRIVEKAMAYYQVPAQFSPEIKLLPQAARTAAVRATSQTFTR